MSKFSMFFCRCFDVLIIQLSLLFKISVKLWLDDSWDLTGSCSIFCLSVVVQSLFLLWSRAWMLSVKKVVFLIFCHPFVFFDLSSGTRNMQKKCVEMYILLSSPISFYLTDSRPRLFWQGNIPRDNWDSTILFAMLIHKIIKPCSSN